MSKFHRVVVMAATLAMAGGTALAQSGSGGGFDKPLRGSAGGRERTVQPRGETQMTLRQSEGDNQYELRIRGNRMSASINGEEVEPEQIRRKGERVELLDEDGNTVTTFEVGRAGMLRMMPQPSVPGMPAIPGGPQMEPPKVMLGVTMSEPGQSLREQLELAEGQGVLLANVFADLPAHEAGLRSNDVIVSFDGETPITGEKIREILREKDPGDTVEVTVLRRGESKKFKIKLDQYNPERFPAQPQAWVQGAPGEMPEDARKMLEEQMRMFGERGDLPPMVWGPGENRGMRFYVPGTPNAAETQRIQELEGRIKELNKRLDQLSKQLETLQKQLDKSGN